MSIVAILGDGAFGTALATVLVHNGHAVKLWCHNAAVLASIQQTRYNELHLPGVLLDKNIVPTSDLAQALHEVSFIVEAVPTKFLRSIFMQAKNLVQEDWPWVLLSKGIEQDTLLFSSQILDDVFGKNVQKVVISGPSFARDVAQKKMTAVTIAGDNSQTVRAVEKLLANNYFSCSVSDDVLGVQVCGAVKNCIALLMGLLDGAAYAENTQSYLFFKALGELKTLLQALGCDAKTLYELCGIGDIFLTCTGKQSRNREVGRRLGSGETLENILSSMQSVPEGINTLASLQQLCDKKNIQLPLLQKLYQVVFEKKPFIIY